MAVAKIEHVSSSTRVPDHVSRVDARSIVDYTVMRVVLSSLLADEKGCLSVKLCEKKCRGDAVSGAFRNESLTYSWRSLLFISLAFLFCIAPAQQANRTCHMEFDSGRQDRSKSNDMFYKRIKKKKEAWLTFFLLVSIWLEMTFIYLPGKMNRAVSRIMHTPESSLYLLKTYQTS